MVRTNDHTDVIPVEAPEHRTRPGDGPSSAPFEKPAGQVDTVPGHACPHCGAEMIPHDAPEDSPKHNAWHCDACGGCWVHRGSAWFLRPGHTAPAGWDGGTLSGGEP